MFPSAACRLDFVSDAYAYLSHHLIWKFAFEFLMMTYIKFGEFRNGGKTDLGQEPSKADVRFPESQLTTPMISANFNGLAPLNAFRSFSFGS
jgi:hypothetical protein